MFGQIAEITSKSSDVPRAGQSYSSDAFKMVLDMINIFNGITPAMWQKQKRRGKARQQTAELENDADGSATLRLLEKVKDVATLVSDNGTHNPGSIGLDQAVYSYGVTGKFHTGAFIASLRFAKELEAQNKLKNFTKVRADFEEFLVKHKVFINQLAHSKGSRTRPVEAMLQMHRIILECLESGTRTARKIVRKLKAHEQLKDLKDVTNIPSTENRRKRFSKEAEQAKVVLTILETRERCPECGARLPPSCRSKDHRTRSADGGKGTLANLAYTHAYCNTGKKIPDATKTA